MFTFFRSILLTSFLILSGCSGLFFFPDSEIRLTPKTLGLAFEDVKIETDDNVELHAWFLPAKEKAKATILFLHGNAENISTHIASVHWLPNEGYNVLLLDYRGYGLSEGSATFEGVRRDVIASLRYLKEVRHETLPIAVLGQSLGGSVAISALAESEQKKNICALVVDSAFCDYHGIAQEKLAQFWLTWPLQVPLSWLVSNDHSPKDSIAELAPLPILIIQGSADQIVDVSNSRCLFEHAREPKFIDIAENAPHIGSLRTESLRNTFLSFLEATCLQP